MHSSESPAVIRSSTCKPEIDCKACQNCRFQPVQATVLWGCGTYPVSWRRRGGPLWTIFHQGASARKSASVVSPNFHDTKDMTGIGKFGNVHQHLQQLENPSSYIPSSHEISHPIFPSKISHDISQVDLVFSGEIMWNPTSFTGLIPMIFHMNPTSLAS